MLEEVPPAPMQEPNADFRRELAEVINRHSRENGSNTPDFILAGYLASCLTAWDMATWARERWYGRTDRNGEPVGPAEVST
jgi:hypothetical protein